MMPPVKLRVLLLALLLLATACMRVEVEDLPDDIAVGGSAEPAGAPAEGEPVVEEPGPGDDLEVTLNVIEGAGGAILAFVPVTINGQGPYSFALDTGASGSVIDESIADELNLEQVGETRGVTGVTGATEASSVQIEEWNIEGVDLGARPAIVLDLGGAGAEGPGIQGLLGSDVLSAFGAITVDYDAGVLRLRPRDT